MKLALACDHGGYLLKEELKDYLLKNNYEVLDCGTNSLDSCDYPYFSKKASELVQSGKCQFGIVICTSGEGVCMTSNKFKGIRCGLVYNEEVARLIREHNDANMMAIGARYTSTEMAIKYVEIFLKTEFAGGRHQKRVDLIEK